MNVKKGKWLVVLLAIAMLATVGSAVSTTSENGNGCESCEPELIVELIAGQDMVVGTVTVTNDDEQVCVTYALDEDALEAGWLIYETHLYVGDGDFDGVLTRPNRRLGGEYQANPIPGLFPYGDDELEGVAEWSFCVSLKDLGVEFCDEVFVAAHAVVKRIVGMEAESATIYGNIGGYTGSGPQGDIYVIDPLARTEELIFDNPSTDFEADWYPNALAYDEDNERLYYATHRDKLVFYDLNDEEVKDADPDGIFDNNNNVLGAAFGDGSFWYILNQSGKLYQVDFNGDGIATGRTEYVMTDMSLTQGDIVYDDGMIYGSSGTGAGGLRGFFTYDTSDPGSFTVLEEYETGINGLQLAWGLDEDGEKVLYGCRGIRVDGEVVGSEWFTVDLATGVDTPIDYESENAYQDLASFIEYNEIWESETAWGDGERFNQRGNWGMFFKYKICEPDNGNGNGNGDTYTKSGSAWSNVDGTIRFGTGNACYFEYQPGSGTMEDPIDVEMGEGVNYIKVGIVSVWDDGNKLYVKFLADEPKYKWGKVDLYAGAAVPTNSAPGLLGHNFGEDDPEQEDLFVEHTFEIEGLINSATIYIAGHADVYKQETE